MKLLIGCLIVSSLCSYSTNRIETISSCENDYSDFYFESSAPVSIANKFLNNNLSVDAAISRIPVHKDDNYHKLELVKYLPKTNTKKNIVTQYVNVNSYIAGTNSVCLDIKSSNPRKSITDNDNRQNIDYCSKYLPVSNVGRITFSLLGDAQYGTAFFIGNGLVMTAAHCVFDKEKNVYCNNFEVNFSRTNDGIFSISSSVKEAYIPYDYVKNTDDTEDWAILKLDNDLSSKIPSITIAAEVSLKNVSYTAIGVKTYSNKKTSFIESTGYSIYKDSESYYDIYSYADKGMSGGPIVAYFSEPDERDPNIENTYEYIVGIASNRITNKSNSSINYMRAAKIKKSIINACLEIAKE